MGIPHLISYLQPYATPTILGDESAARTEKDSPPQPRVIDGPALAYHIYHVCLAKRQDARNALEATPSYEEIIYCTVRWLNKLRNKYGVEL